MRNLGCFLGLSLIGLAGCQQQEPAAAPLAPPPPATAPAPPPAPTAEGPKEAPKPPALTGEQKAKLFQDCWASFNQKDWAKFSNCYADNATVDHLDTGMPPAANKTDAVEKQIKPFATAFPDLAGETQLTLISGDQIAAIALMKGTHKAVLPSPQGDLQPTNKKFGQLIAQILEVGDDGKVKREWIAYDNATMLGQLGLINMPHRKAQEAGAAEKPVVVASNSDAEKNNLALYKQGIDAFNKHDVTALMATLADDAVFSEQSAPADRVGKKEIQKAFDELFKGIPDAKLDISKTFAAGDYVVAHGTFSGTNSGPMPSMKLYKKTDKKVNVQFIEIDKIQGGKLKNIWLFSNGMAFAQQLGMTPPIKGIKPPPAAKPEAAGKPGAKPGAEAKGATPATPAKPGAPGAGATPAKPAEPAKPSTKPSTPTTPPAPPAVPGPSPTPPKK